MNEIKSLLSQVLKSGKEKTMLFGENFSIEAQFENVPGVQFNDDYIKLYHDNSLIGEYDPNEQTLYLKNDDFENEVTFFGECLAAEGWGL